MYYEAKVKKIGRESYIVYGSERKTENGCVSIPNIGLYCQVSDSLFAGNINDIEEIRAGERHPAYKGGIAYCLVIRQGALFTPFNRMRIPVYVLIWYINMQEIKDIVRGLNVQRQSSDLPMFDEMYNSNKYYEFKNGIVNIKRYKKYC